jgi:ActR/RegA family two-component response regulator
MDDSHVRSDRQLKPQPTTASAPRALLVMVDDLYARTVARWLSTRGWQVVRAARAAEALAFWKTSDTQAVLIDLDDDGLGALSLLATAHELGLPARAVVCTRDRNAARDAASLSPALRRRLGIQEITVRPCHIGTVEAALARAAAAAGDGRTAHQAATAASSARSGDAS